jgi:thiol-disulfide isomerase/thioredoxin
MSPRVRGADAIASIVATTRADPPRAPAAAGRSIRIASLILGLVVLASTASRAGAAVLVQAQSETGPGLAAASTSEPVPLPEFAVTTDDGRRVGPEAFGGRVILLNFWATWCGPCRAEMPALDRLQEALGGERFAVVAVSVDRTGKLPVDRFYHELSLEHLDRYFDPRRKAANALGISGLPTTILVDPAGLEIGRLYGALQWDKPEIEAWLEKLTISDADHE